MPNRTCEGCGESELLARGWYEVSPTTGKLTAEGYCDSCYEKLHTRYIRGLYRKREEEYEDAKDDNTVWMW